MGDRGNIVVQFDEGKLWMYTHWRGSDIPGVLAHALDKGRSRWNDESYLARIIFCALVAGEEDDLAGYGLSLVMCDNEHDIVVVDTTKKLVKIFEEGQLDGIPAKESYTYDDYIKKFKE